MDDSDQWAMFLDMSRDDCKRQLRRLELEAYSNLVSVFRAQGSLTANKRRLLKSIAQTLSISEERHKAECRRAVNSEKLTTIAYHMGGQNTGTEWAIEGRRLVPLLPRLVPQTAFTVIADQAAHLATTEGARLPRPTSPARIRLPTPPLDETLLEPSIPEASQTAHVPSMSSTIPVTSGDVRPELPQQTITSKLEPHSAPQSNVHSTSSEQAQGRPILQPLKQSQKTPVAHPRTKLQPRVANQDPRPRQSVAVSVAQPRIQQKPLYAQSTVPQQIPPQSQEQNPVVVFMKTEELSKEDQEPRKRRRSTSFDSPISSEGSVMPPPSKKSPTSASVPAESQSQLPQPPATMSPQSQSALLQQQTLNAAAAAAIAADSQPSAPQTSVQLVQTNQRQQPLSSNSLNVAVTRATALSKLSMPSTITAGFSSTSASSTHKVIIVSSTAPSILQRSLSVPVVKTMTTSAPSQPSTSTLVLNAASQQVQSSGNVVITPASSDSSGNGNAVTSTPSGNVVVSSKLSGKLLSQNTPKSRSRANSLVIPVTPNQAGVVNNVGVPSMHLKTTVPAVKTNLLKSGDGGGLKIMPISNVGSNAKILPKPGGSGPVYVVSSTSGSTSNISMVTRTVPAGARVMTLSTNSLPRAAVSSAQSGTILSMQSKPIQISTANSACTTPTGPGTTGVKPNVIVVQKGTSGLSRGVTLSSGKEIVSKVLLSGKTIAPVNQTQSLVQVQSTVQAQTQSPVQLQSSPTNVSTPRIMSIQKLPSAVVQGSSGSGNVIVLDLSQEQLNSSSMLSELLASGLLGSSSIVNVTKDGTILSNSVSSTSGLSNKSSNHQSNDPNKIALDVSTPYNSDTTGSKSTPVSCSDIFSTALSSANITFNDFLDDTSLDGMPTAEVDGMHLGLSSVENSNSNHSTNANYATNESQQNCVEIKSE